MDQQLTIAPINAVLEEDTTENDKPYNLFLWNDPITPMIVVTKILKKLFGFSKAKAEQLMLVAHEEGKAVVFTGPKEQAERYCIQLHAAGLQATVGKDS
jgi:ATP-dependent Clp protease adaptor protein ClpS